VTSLLADRDASLATERQQSIDHMPGREFYRSIFEHIP